MFILTKLETNYFALINLNILSLFGGLDFFFLFILLFFFFLTFFLLNFKNKSFILLIYLEFLILIILSGFIIINFYSITNFIIFLILIISIAACETTLGLTILILKNKISILNWIYIYNQSSIFKN